MDTTKCYRKFTNKIWLSSPTMHGPELKYVMEAYESNWTSTVGANINEVKRPTYEKIECKYPVTLSTGTAALHTAVRLTGVKCGDKVFCSDLTFGTTVDPVICEGGIPVFVDTGYDTWSVDPATLERAFEIYPDVKVMVVTHLYDTPGKVNEIKSIRDRHGTVAVEDTAESLGTTYRGIQTGNFDMYDCISYNGDKIITGSSGSMLLTGNLGTANRMCRWSTQAREGAPWYRHEKLGYNYRMSNLIAGVVRRRYPYLEEHIRRKKKVYEWYKEGLSGLPVRMSPYDSNKSEPDFWLSCMLIDEVAICRQIRGEKEALCISQSGKSCPTEILEDLSECNTEGRPIWKPMHMQLIYKMNGFITHDGNARTSTNAYLESGSKGENGMLLDVGIDTLHRGLCLPNDNKMTAPQQETVIEIVKSCFE